MSKRSTVNLQRRRLLQASAAGLAASPLAVMLARAEEKVTEDDPTAQSLAYKHDAEQVDNPKRQADQDCLSCQLYQGGEADEWAPCPIFANKLVAAKGWCSAWVKRGG